MSKFKDFGEGKRNAASEKISFKIHDEEFFCVEEMQGLVILELVAASSSEDSGDSVRSITQFFSAALEEESYKRFQALVKDKKKIVSAETLGEIVGWVMSQYGDRPESPSEV